MITSFSVRIVLCTMLVGLFSCGDQEASVSAESVASEQFERLRLPKALREVSGLAASPVGTVFAIADENGAVYEISFAEGAVDAVPGFGEPPVKGDFEGIALKDDWLYATTSDGKLYRRSVSNGDPEAFEEYKTKLGKQCEIEGLAAHPANDHIWFLCKTPQKKKYEDKLVLFAWSPDELERVPSLDLEVPYAQLGFKKHISPSGVSFSSDGTQLIVVAAIEQAFVVIESNGQWVRSGRLPDRKFHPQTEGIAVVGSSVYLADEGSGKKGAISHYANGF